MKKIYSLLIAILLVTVMINPVSAAQIHGTKALGMGGAFTAVADDASAIYWNPAGLTQTSLVGIQTSVGGQMNQEVLNFIKDVQSDSADGIPDLEEESVNVNGMMSANLGKFALGAIANDQIIANSTTATNILVGQGLAGLGMELIDPPLLGAVSVGASGKLLKLKKDEINESGDLTNLKDETGYGADVGALVTLSDIDILNLKAGATVKNAVNNFDIDHSAVQRSTTVGLGATFNFPLINIFSARVAADLEMPEEGENIQRVGAEGTLGLFSVRAGAYGNDVTKSDDRRLTLGAGFNLPFIDVNAAADGLIKDDKRVKLSGTFNF